jgi:hypothetical protein
MYRKTLVFLQKKGNISSSFSAVLNLYRESLRLVLGLGKEISILAIG